MQKSRLSRKLDKESKRNFILSIAGIVIIILFLAKFGVPLLINVSSFISGTRNAKDVGEKNDSLLYVSAPVLNLFPSATNSASVTISGIASSGQKIKLYVNDNFRDETTAKNDNNFIFQKITLKKGTNILKAKAVAAKYSKKESSFSDTITIVFKDDKPSLSIDSPQDGQSFSKEENTTKVSGKTDPAVKLTVNDFWAIVEEDGTFSYSLRLHDGENIIKIQAVDEAGNKTEKEIKVTYSS